MNRFIRPRWRLTLAFAAGTVVVGVAWAVSPDTSARGFAIAAVIRAGPGRRRGLLTAGVRLGGRS